MEQTSGRQSEKLSAVDDARLTLAFDTIASLQAQATAILEEQSELTVVENPLVDMNGRPLSA